MCLFIYDTCVSIHIKDTHVDVFRFQVSKAVHTCNASNMLSTYSSSGKYVKQQSGAVGACWAHNPEVDGSKPSSANFFFFDHAFFITFFIKFYVTRVLLQIFLLRFILCVFFYRYLEKCTEFFRAFVSSHLRRVESNPHFSVIEFLTLLLKYSLKQVLVYLFRVYIYFSIPATSGWLLSLSRHLDCIFGSSNYCFSRFFQTS